MSISEINVTHNITRWVWKWFDCALFCCDCIFCILWFQMGFLHDDVIKWNQFPRYWPFVRGIHWSPLNSPHKGQWRGAFMSSLICAWINAWVNNRETGDVRRHRAHYDVIVISPCFSGLCQWHWGNRIIFPGASEVTLENPGKNDWYSNTQQSTSKRDRCVPLLGCTLYYTLEANNR